jgi:hypothetical protein
LENSTGVTSFASGKPFMAAELRYFEQGGTEEAAAWVEGREIPATPCHCAVRGAC